MIIMIRRLMSLSNQIFQHLQTATCPHATLNIFDSVCLKFSRIHKIDSKEFVDGQNTSKC